MTKQKSTKKVLLTSVLALMICFTMLIGTTFAWFTDSVTSGNNRIVAGNLDVDLQMWDGTKYESIAGGQGDIFTTGSNANNSSTTLWEPGKTQVAYLAIENKGSLDLKYTVALDVENVSKNLYKVMEYAITKDAKNGTGVSGWTSGTAVAVGTQSVSGNVSLEAGATHYFALSVHMKEEANNDYQGGEVSFDLTVLATQLNSEADSFNNSYDKDALYAAGNGLYIDKTDDSYVAMSTEGLATVATLASSDSSITSVTLVTDEGKVEVPVVSSSSAIDNVINAGKEIIVLAGGTSVTLDAGQNKEMTIVGDGTSEIKTEANELPSGSGDFCFQGADVVLENITVTTTDKDWDGFQNANSMTYNNCTINNCIFLSGNSTFNNCTFNVPTTNNRYNVWAYSCNSGAYVAEFNDCVFNCSGKAIYVDGNDTKGITVKIDGCKFYDKGDGTVVENKAAVETGHTYGSKYEIYISNSTFAGFAVNPNGTSTGSVIWANKNSLPNTKLNVVINGVDVY